MRAVRDRRPSVPTWRRPARLPAALLTGALVWSLLPLALGAMAPGGGAGTQTPVAEPAVAERAASRPRLADTTAPTSFRMASFNVLGAGHTDDGDRAGFEDSRRRMKWSVRLLDEQQLSVVGLQEFQEPQLKRFKELTGDQFGVYPGNELTLTAMHNSIIWRRSTWRLVEARTEPIPYFDGNKVRMPYVLLENRDTGDRAWFFNTHNPADAHGPAQRWRDAGFRIEADLVNRLREQYPAVPVFSTGDKNDRESYFCPVAQATGMRAANGGSATTSSCETPPMMRVDWVMGTPDAVFSGYRALRTELVQKITDHPVIVTNVTVPDRTIRQSPIRRVVVISVEGLASRALGRFPDQTRAFRRMLARGTGTLDARTAYERTSGIANIIGTLTGRLVAADAGGHGVASDHEVYDTVHAAAGRYTSSIFDLVHNAGGRTAFFTSKEELALIDRTWSESGGADPYGTDNGPDKISVFHRAVDDQLMVQDLRQLLTDQPPKLTVAQLSLLDEAGHRHGWMRPGYQTALKESARLVGSILRTIRSTPKLAKHTLVVLTAEHGGRKRTHGDRRLAANYKVPFVVEGPGVPAGTDLFAINPTYRAPGGTRGTYAEPVIRNSSAANLVTTMLGLPALPGSSLNEQQDLTVLRTR